jgi:predicted branched-subunit amino acid permease
MSREVSHDLAKLCGLAGAVAVVVAVAWVPMAGVGVAAGMLALLAVALISPAGPTVLFELPQEVDR